MIYSLIVCRVFLCLLLILPSLTYSASSETKKTKKNCFIQTKTILKSGTIKESVVPFYFKTKTKCSEMRKILEDNFDPAHITKSEAKMDWRGK